VFGSYHWRVSPLTRLAGKRSQAFLQPKRFTTILPRPVRRSELPSHRIHDSVPPLFCLSVGDSPASRTCSTTLVTHRPPLRLAAFPVLASPTRLLVDHNDPIDAQTPASARRYHQLIRRIPDSIFPSTTSTLSNRATQTRITTNPECRPRTTQNPSADQTDFFFLDKIANPHFAS
jgi:hypothetical protein